jgi:putative peptidoglycan lipid II flippase
VIFNGVLAVAIATAVAPGSLTALAVAVVLAALLRWLPQAAQALALAGGSVLAAGVRPRRIDAGRVGRAYLAAFGGTGVILGLPLVARALASLGAPGDVALLNYATRIVDLPAAAVATVGSVAALPHLSERSAAGDRAGATRSLRSLLLATSAVTLPATLVLAALAEPIVAVLYARGAIDATAAQRIASLAVLALLSLPAQGIAAALLATFVARRSLGFPLAASIAGLVLFAVAGGALVGPLGVTGVVVAYVGLHWGLALALLLRLRSEGIDVTSGRRDIGAALRSLLGTHR